MSMSQGLHCKHNPADFLLLAADNSRGGLPISQQQQPAPASLRHDHSQRLSLGGLWPGTCPSSDFSYELKPSSRL